MNPATAYEQYFLESPEDDELPEFKQWSDMMAVYWLRSNPTPKNLRFYIVTHITNDATVDIMSKVLRDAPEITNKGTVPRWPGLTRDASTPEGQSLIGMYNI